MQVTAGTELFYVTTYEDVDAIVKPHLKPRGRRVMGPFLSFGDAVSCGVDGHCSHYEVTMQFLGRDMDIPFHNLDGEDSG